jgi:multidrug resistance efflux pump
MLEILLCSMFTLLPDYLYRRYVQGKRIVSCLMLAIALITMIFYFHPSTTSATAFFRTVPIISEGGGRVAEIYVKLGDEVQEGTPLFRLDDSKQQATVETARRRIIEIDAQMAVARNDRATAEGQVVQAKGAYQQALDELETKRELNRRGADIVARREIERLEVAAATRKGAVDAAESTRDGIDTRLSTLLPAQRASAQAALAEAEADLNKTVVRAGVTGQLEQFALRVGEIVNPILRPAGVLIPKEAGRGRLQAGFGQIEGQVMKVGMLAEVTCVSKPWTVVPMVITYVQDYIAAGQFRGGEVLVDARQVTRPGTILVFLEPLYAGTLDDLPPGSSCIANAYTSNHELLASKDTGFFKGLALHAVDAVGLVHALLLRIQALILPIRELVFAGH